MKQTNNYIHAQNEEMTSPMTSSPASSPDPNIPPVSSFIKNSDAVLYPSSPLSDTTSPQRYLSPQDDSTIRSRATSESELNQIKYEQNRHASVSSCTAAVLNGEESLRDSSSRVRPVGLHVDQPSIIANLSSTTLPSQHVALPEQECRKTLCNIKREIVESPTATNEEWMNHNLHSASRSSAFSFVSIPNTNNQVSTSICSVPSPVAAQHTGFLQRNTVLKQENLFPAEQFNQNDSYHCIGSVLPSPNAFGANPQGYFPHHHISSTHKPINASPNPAAFMHHHPFHQHSVHCPVTSAESERILQNGLIPHRVHPYLNFSPNYPATINGTIPYRPRFSRRNNPDLEKKRVHKCDHPGKYEYAKSV